MVLLKKPIQSLIGVIVLIMLAMGLYSGINNTYMLIGQSYNYFFGPLGDQLYDAARIVYPIFEGHASWRHLLDPFAEHRVLMERLLMLYDMTFHHGMEIMHPYRLVITFWLACLLFIVNVVLVNHKMALHEKMILSSCALGLFLANLSFCNFMSAILFTWPLIVLFSLSCFICLAAYADSVRNSKTSHRILFLMLTTLFAYLAIFSFNIGLIVWPIVYLVLYKQGVLRKHVWVWLLLAGLSYYIYFNHGWHPGTFRSDHGLERALLHPIRPFLYFSRIVSVPFIENASHAASISTILMGIALLSTGIYFLSRFWLLAKWSYSDSILFSFLLFSLCGLTAITLMRAWVDAEYLGIGSRFLYISFMAWLSILTSYFRFFGYKQKAVSPACVLLTTVLVGYLFFYFIRHDTGSFPVGEVSNPYFIALSTDIPINQSFVNYARIFNNDDDINHHQYANAVQKHYKMGVYALWPSQWINKQWTTHGARCNAEVTHHITADLRKTGNPALFIESDVKAQQKTIAHSYILYLDPNDVVVGYALPFRQNVRLLPHTSPTQTKWLGAINSSLTPYSFIQAEWVNTASQQVCELGRMTINAIAAL